MNDIHEHAHPNSAEKFHPRSCELYNRPVRLIFAGTPDVAIPSLNYLAARHEIVGVVTRPPAPQGRKRVLTPSPVHEEAEKLGIPVFTLHSLKDPSELEPIAALHADAAAVVAYGAIIPQAALDIPRLGWFNLHFSALPRWRGAAPVQYALAAGETRIGTTVFRIDKGLDTGPIVSTRMHECATQATAQEVLAFLAEQGAEQLHEALCSVNDGSAELTQQTGTPSYAPTLSTNDSRIQWNEPANVIRNKIRAFTPEPGAWTLLAGQRIKISPVNIAPESEHNEPLPAGQIRFGKHIMVGTGTVPILLGDVTASGKKTMPAQAWANGLNKTNTHCFESEAPKQIGGEHE